MGGHDLLVAANRGPVSLERAEGEIRAVRGGGGLVSGVSAALTRAGGLWVCSAMNDHERAVAGNVRRLAEIGVDTGGFDVRMLPVPADTFRAAYNGVANSVLWFVAHLLYDLPRRPVFDRTWPATWAAYERFNAAFADALADEAAPGATVLVQDYHLNLVPGLLRNRRPDLRVGHFTHTPWAPPAEFAVLPDGVGRAILAGLLGADQLGFHTRAWAGAFLDCCAELLPGAVTSRESSGGRVEYAGRSTRVAVHPLGTDAATLRDRAARPDVAEALERLRERTGGRRVIGRVDRTELSKNIVRGLLAYRDLLHEHPEWRGEVVHVVCAYPSRQELPEYREYTESVRQVGEQVLREFGTDDWAPVLVDIANDYPASLATLRASDVLLVNPLRDGMNLVAQEGTILSGAALVLSRQAGAAELIGPQALLVNPYDVGQTAEALHTALTIPEPERRERAEQMAAAAAAVPPADWIAGQLTALS